MPYYILRSISITAYDIEKRIPPTKCLIDKPIPLRYDLLSGKGIAIAMLLPT